MSAVPSARESCRPLLGSARPVTWLFAGDSITQGAAHTRGWRDYTQLYRERLGELARNEDVVVNTAVGGWSLAPFAERLEERALRFRPDAILVMFGTNDATRGEGGLEEFRSRLVAVTARLREARVAAVVLQTPPGIMAVDAEASLRDVAFAEARLREAKLAGLRARLAWLPAYAQAVRDAAAAAGAPLVDHAAAFDEARRRNGMGQLMDGGFHPNEYGHRLMAHTLIRELGIWSEESWSCRLFVPLRG